MFSKKTNKDIFKCSLLKLKFSRAQVNQEDSEKEDTGYMLEGEYSGLEVPTVACT